MRVVSSLSLPALRWLSTAVTPTAIIQRVCRRHRLCARSVGRWSRHVFRSLALFPMSPPPSSPILSKDTCAFSPPSHSLLYCVTVLKCLRETCTSVRLQLPSKCYKLLQKCYKCYRKFMRTYVVYKEYGIRINNINPTFPPPPHSVAVK